jgi:hypothetical protein
MSRRHRRRTDLGLLGWLLIVAAGIALAQVWLSGQQKPAPKPTPKPAAPATPAPSLKAAVPAAQAAQKATAGKTSGPGCTPPFTVPDQSFRTLTGGGLRDAAIWVDDIDSGVFGGFEPFEVYVVTGRLYAPFQLAQGKLGRDNFRKYTKGNYNTMSQGPLVLTQQRPVGQLGFVQDERRFSLRVTGVQPSAWDRDAITAQLCW